MESPFSAGLLKKIEESHLEWLNQFAKCLELLDEFDHGKLDAKGLTKKQAVYPDIQEYQKSVAAMRQDFESGVFGIEKERSFQRAVTQISKVLEKRIFTPLLMKKQRVLSKTMAS